MAIVPQYLAITGFFSMNAFDLVFWAAAALVVARIVNTGDPRLWLLLGGILGLGLQNKISVLFFGFGLAVALLVTPLRSHLLRPQLWLGGLLAAALFVPHLLWQVRYDWPTLEFIRNAKQYKIAEHHAPAILRRADPRDPPLQPAPLAGGAPLAPRRAATAGSSACSASSTSWPS